MQIWDHAPHLPLSHSTARACQLRLYSKSVSAQAVAAHWAAHCSHSVGDNHVEVEFLSLQAFFSIQYGFEHTNDPAWQLAFATKPGLSALETAWSTLVDRQALQRHPKPQGWEYLEWGTMKIIAGPSPSPQQQTLLAQIRSTAYKHVAWNREQMHPELTK